MKNNKNILDNNYVIVSIDKKGRINNKKFVEFKSDDEAITYMKEKNHYKTREESKEMYFVYKIKDVELL
tara:strand:- start:1892 stop:2098 length:207 start_codon:yes stop_codon:yes gene_type:complete